MFPRPLLALVLFCGLAANVPAAELLTDTFKEGQPGAIPAGWSPMLDWNTAFIAGDREAGRSFLRVMPKIPGDANAVRVIKVG